MSDQEDKFKVVVKVNRLMMEVLDEKGQPIIDIKRDTFQNEYQETREKQYRNGDILYLPMSRIKKLGKSVEMVLEPVKVAPVKEPEPVEEISDGEDEPSDDSETPKKEKGEGSGEPTVADLIPKEDPKDKSSAKKSKTPGKQ